ncbi:peptidoglycan-binding domain-containing protein, partial [Escherichia coli]|uniref:peptidoglycan-binding domain-containing protein n=1 Tax=Escherichia coli TaxID=562 RepID=UPI003DA2E99F
GLPGFSGGKKAGRPSAGKPVPPAAAETVSSWEKEPTSGGGVVFFFMLNRALHISTEPSAEWRPLLVEKIKQFQKSHHLKTDGVVGFSTLVHLWQVAGESAYLYRDEANISPETTVKGK